MAELRLWKASSNYMGEEYPDYYVVYGRSRDSTLLDQANFEAALKELGGETDGVKVIRSGHWAAGWVENILVHKDDKKAVAKAQKIVNGLEDYAVIDDALYSQMEYDAAIDNIKDAARGRGHTLTDSQARDAYRWLSDNGEEMENTDDTGFYPSDEQIDATVAGIKRKKSVSVSMRRKRRASSTPSIGGMR